MQEFTLKFPIEHGGETISSLSLRRPKVRDIRKLQNGRGNDGDRSLAMIADLAECDPKLLDEMDPEDLGQINEWLEPILDPKGEARAASGR